MSLLHPDDIAAAKEAVSTYPGEVLPVPGEAFNKLFEGFDEEQVKKILFEFGWFILIMTREILNNAHLPKDSGVPSYLSSLSVSFLNEAVN